MMNGSWSWWGPGVLFMVICMVAMAWMMMGHGAHGGGGSHGAHEDEPGVPRAGRAERILAERFARGEIDTDEYERRLSALHRSGELDAEVGRDA